MVWLRVGEHQVLDKFPSLSDEHGDSVIPSLRPQEIQNLNNQQRMLWFLMFQTNESNGYRQLNAYITEYTKEIDTATEICNDIDRKALPWSPAERYYEAQQSVTNEPSKALLRSPAKRFGSSAAKSCKEKCYHGAQQSSKTVVFSIFSQ